MDKKQSFPQLPKKKEARHEITYKTMNSTSIDAPHCDLHKGKSDTFKKKKEESKGNRDHITTQK